MAKMTSCDFCGKEIKKGVFAGESFWIDVGNNMQGNLTCCEDCYNKYHPEEKAERKRFATKLENMKKSTKKRYSNKEIAKMFAEYIDEKYVILAKHGDELPEYYSGGFVTNSNGCFYLTEFCKGYINSDVSATDMIKSLDKSQSADCCCFDKNDITKIEYARVGRGDILSFSKTAFSYEIRLNDESVMTYKPCITRTAVIGKGVFLTGRSAEQEIVNALTFFKMGIGSDLPIKRIDKIK